MAPEATPTIAVRRAVLTAAALLVLALAAPAAQAAAPSSCPGRPIAPDRVVTGEFGADIVKSYVMVPFDVPRGTTAIRVKYCYDQPEGQSSDRHTLDLGLYSPRRHDRGLWGAREFRGWGGSSHPDVTLSAQGFSTEAQYTANPRIEPPGKTTRGFLPGPIRRGRWAAELGVAAVVTKQDGDLDGKVAWRVEIDYQSDPAFARDRYRPARYDTRPARRAPGWYAGDFHVHAEHSAYGNATMTETFGYGFSPIAEGGAGLDFITLSDYVSGSAWGEIGRYQPRYPGKLIVPSAEVITYRGHFNNHGSGHFVDYRASPIYERRADGSLALLRGPTPPSRRFDEIHRFGGWTQVNHPTIFPPTTAAAARACRGCYWEFSDAETQWSKVDAFEIATGPPRFGNNPNPFTVTAIRRYDQLRGEGFRIAAVGSSDSHTAGRFDSLGAPVGTATTVVYAPELSERGIECGVKAGHTYVKVTGNAAPDLRFSAAPPGYRGRPAIMGDVVRAESAGFAARVLRGSGRTLLVFKDGVQVGSVPVTSDDFRYSFAGSGPGLYRLQLDQGRIIEDVSTPIQLVPGLGSVVSRCAR